MYWRQLDLRVWRGVLSGREAIYNTFRNKFCADVLMSQCAPPIISRKTKSFKDIWNNEMTSSFISKYFWQHRPNPRFLVVSRPSSRLSPWSPLDRGDPRRSLSRLQPRPQTRNCPGLRCLVTGPGPRAGVGPGPELPSYRPFPASV